MGMKGHRTAEPPASDEAESRFCRLYEEYRRTVLAYAVRRTSDPADAADVVADTFLVAWRRVSEIPAGDDARLWLYGVARRTLANRRRGERRRERLAARLRQDLPAAVAAVAPPTSGGPVIAALEALSDEDREVLLLKAWEELEPAEIASVLGISRVAARSRLHRARSRLQAELSAHSDAIPVPGGTRYTEAS